MSPLEPAVPAVTKPVSTVEDDRLQETAAKSATAQNKLTALLDEVAGDLLKSDFIAARRKLADAQKDDAFTPVAAELKTAADLVAKARRAGLTAAQLILDPGLGFGDPPGADPAANLALLRGVAAYGQGFPVLVGASRKRFIGTLTREAEPARRVGGSVAAALLAVQAGAVIVRVHDVAETAQALRMLR